MSDKDFQERDPGPTPAAGKGPSAKERDRECVGGTQSNREKRGKERTASNKRPLVKKQEIKRKRKSDKARDNNNVRKRTCETTNQEKKGNMIYGKGSKSDAERRRQLKRQWCTETSGHTGRSSGGGIKSSTQEDSNHNSQINTKARTKKQLAG